jgi:hypothetical protein
MSMDAESNLDAGALPDVNLADVGFDAATLDQGMDAATDAPDAESDSAVPPSPGIVVTPTTGLITTEMGGTATFTIVLASQPTADVRVAITSDDTTEATVSPAAVTFTILNWNAPQLILVTGVDDAEADGAQGYSIVTAAATSTDTSYAGLDTDDVDATNLDDDTPGVFVVPTSGLVTSELGGSDTFTLRLLAQPLGDVTIPLTSSNTDEATVSPASVTFTIGNWAAPQTVTVTGVDDAVEDGNQSYLVQTQPATSSDAAYNAFDADDVGGTNRDDELAAIFTTPTVGLSTSESGGTATFTVVLQAPPEADVMIPIASSDTTEGTVSVASVVFTTSNWSIPQAIVVTGIDDAVADGNQPYEVLVGPATSADPLYADAPSPTVLLSNIDDDVPSFVVGDPSALTTTETGGTQTFSLVLTSQPTSSVTISISSGDTTEGTVAPALRTFSTVNWNVPQVITVTGVDDAIADGNQDYNVVVHVALAADPAYGGLADQQLVFTNVDNETAGVTVTPIEGLTTSESGGTATFTVVLNSMPSASVTVNLASDLLTEGTAAPLSVVFTTFNWNTPQTVTVTGVNDMVADGARVYHIITAAAASADPQYNGIDVSDVTVINADNDTPGIYVSPMAIAAPEGATGTFSVVLGSQPTANVVIPLHMQDVSQGTLAPASVTFTTVNWNTPQVVTVTGIDDGVMDGTFINTAFTDAAMSTDLTYGGLNGPDVTVTHIDRVSIIVTPTTGLVTTEARTVANFTIVLSAAPTANVTVPLGTSDASEGAPLQTSVTFTPANWATPQQVDVRGADDAMADGTQAYTVLTSSASSSDSRYAGVNPADVACSNTDNDIASVDLHAVGPLTTSENRTTASFIFTLGASTTGNIHFYTSDATEATISPTGTSGSFALGHRMTLTVTGVDDLIDDGDVPYTVYATISSPDSGYNMYPVPIISMTNLDNEEGAIAVSPSSLVTVSEGGAVATVQLVLTTAPTADVTINMSSDDVGEGTVLPSSVTFTTANWNTPRVLTITGVGDGILDGDQLFSIVTSPAVSTDLAFNGVNASDVSVTNVDLQSGRLISATPTYSPALGAIDAVNGSALSADNRYAVFESSATNLVAGDTNASTDVFVRDRVLGTTTRANVTSAGAQTSGQASDPVISGNGRYVAFRSHATDLVAGDTNNAGDIFVRDLVAGTTTRVSLTSASGELNNTSFTPDISDDGRYVSFLFTGTNAVAGDTNGAWDVFVRDTMLGTTVRASVSSTGAQLSGGSGFGNMSADGRYVVFPTTAIAAPPDTGNFADIYVRDLLMNTTTLVSQSTAGLIGNDPSYNPAISGDGRYIAFNSYAFNLVAGDTNNASDVFVRDTLLGTTTRVSVSSGGAEANGASILPTLSANGLRVAFISDASNLVGDDTNETMDAFVRDTASAATYLVSRSPSGQPQNEGSSTRGAIAPDGTFLVLETAANNILPEVFDTGWGHRTVFAVPVP